ncbi:UDP-glucosyltransferase 29-like [Diospyros lotus]|uniref:UDP-glucosyltransferase 29-like n=1 Tax=Diospyros lotus TaxID=55363 RepID=UPI0022518C90|nr:UDP-glucosyltransferase 29-like [Diospyros lotus]
MDPIIKVLMFPWLAHGHLSPFLELAKKLSTRNFKIFICSSPVNLSSIKRRITEKQSDSIKLVELHVPSLPDLPPQLHTTKDLPPHLMVTLKQAFDLAEPNFSDILKALKPDILVYDFLQPWAPAIAASHDVPAVNFITSSTTMTAFANHLYRYPLATFPFPSISIRGYDRVDISHLLNPSRDLDKDKTRCFDCVKRSSDIVLIKSFREVEGKYIDYLSGLVGKKVVPVPLVQDCIINEDDEGIFEWLNKKGKGSTVCVSFGTEYFLTEEEMEEIAHGLELSGVNFIWVLRFPTGANTRAEEALPEGFLERVGERGMVVEGWFPQVSILQHPSIGGFVSHCGWSSVMESMKIGVPIIAVPMHLDQPVNARLVAETGSGVEVERGADGKLERQRVAEVIKHVVFDDAGEDVRKKARELGETLTMKGEEDIDAVVEELVKLCMNRKNQDHDREDPNMSTNQQSFDPNK